MNHFHFHSFYENEGYGGDIIDVNRPCPDPDCIRPDRYVPADTYDDFIASDVLAAFIRRTGNDVHLVNHFGAHWLELKGQLPLTPEQAAVLSPLFAARSEG